MTQSAPMTRRAVGKSVAADLAFAAEHGAGMNDRARADRGVAGDGGVRQETHAVTEHGMRADEAEGADLDAGAKRRAVFDDRGRVHRHAQPALSERIMALNSPSAHSASPT